VAAFGIALGTSSVIVPVSPAAFARGPSWEFADAQPFTVPAALCGFKIRVRFPTDRSYFKVLKAADGSVVFLSNGFIRVSYENLQSGRTVTEVEPGPSKTTVFADDSIEAVAGGHNGIFLMPADAKRFGLPTVSVTVGRLTETVAADGTIMSLSLRSHVLVDVCTALR
jgi:hypothetical protein